MPRHVVPVGFACLIAPLGAACIDRAITEVEPEQARIETLEFDVELNPNVDLLFVIDNSGSMGREQDQIAVNFQRMIEVLETLPTGLPNLHLGVVTTDVGAGQSCPVPTPPPGVMRVTGPSSCAPLGGATERFLVDVEDGVGGRDRNYAGTLAEAFACIATAGTSGCGFEQPLEAMRLALSRPENAGFVRPDALLAIVLLTDEDDCSAFDDGLFVASETTPLGPRTNFRCFRHALECDGGVPAETLGVRTECVPRADSEYITPIEELAAFLHGLRPRATKLLVGGIMGDAPTEARPIEVGWITNTGGAQELAVLRTCEIGEDDPHGAFPPIRTDAFLAQFRDRFRTSICDADLSQAMIAVGEHIVDALYGSCVRGDLRDADPRTTGVQAECSVTEVQHPHGDDEVRTILPACAGADPAAAPNRPCFAIVPDEERCRRISDHFLRITIHYPDGVVRDADTIVQAQCVTD
jgi:hypothetical protein